jgi:hypothetical protein
MSENEKRKITPQEIREYIDLLGSGVKKAKKARERKITGSGRKRKKSSSFLFLYF